MSEQQTAKPLARYAPYRRAGDLVYFAGVVPADPASGQVVRGYADLEAAARGEAGESGDMSVDSKDGPMAAQAWWVLDRLRNTVAEAGGTLDDVVNLTQYVCDLRDFPVYERVRAKFFETPPASTVVRVVELLPTSDVRLEVQAVAHIPGR